MGQQARQRAAARLAYLPVLRPRAKVMHLVFVCEEYPPAPHGGTGSSYQDLAEGLVAAGHKVSVVGISTTLRVSRVQDETQAGVRVARLPRAPRFPGTRVGGWLERQRLRWWLRNFHSESPVTVVECSDYNGWLSLGGIRGVPTVTRIRGSNLFFDAELRRPPQKFEHHHERASLARATHLASVSKYAADRTLALCNLADRSCSILPNGVDSAVFAPDPQVQVEPGLIAFVNSLNPKKGIEELIEAANQIFTKYSAARLVIIGEDTQRKKSGGYLAELRERVRPEF